jgi:acetyl-CoA C-acetyltransferase
VNTVAKLATVVVIDDRPSLEEKIMLAGKAVRKVAIIGGNRIPFARSNSAYIDTSNQDMLTAALDGLVDRFKLHGEKIDEVAAGAVMKHARDFNLVRESVLGSKLAPETPAYDLQQACGTGLEAAILVANKIALGQIDCAIAGGVDTTSDAPLGVNEDARKVFMALNRAKTNGERAKLGLKLLNPKSLMPDIPKNGEPRTGLSMGEHQAITAAEWGIPREAQDELAHRSHTLAAQSWQEGKLASEVMTAYAEPFKGALEQDNNIRFDSKLEGYAKLRPVFDRKYGSVTAANATPLTDGASAVLMMTESKAKALGYTPLGYIKSYAFAAIDVWEDMLMGPSYASPIALERAGMTLNDLTLIEMHEAFAAQTLANVKMFASDKFAQEKLGRSKATGEIDMDKFNVMGSSIAYGHPFAATGTRMITQMLNELNRRGGGTGLITACAAGGLGAAMILETA